MAFCAPAEALYEQGNSRLGEGKVAEASALFLRACALLRIARFPYITSRPDINCLVKWHAWKRQKEIYLHAATRWDAPVREVKVPHTFRKANEGIEIPVYVRRPVESDDASRSTKMGQEIEGADEPGAQTQAQDETRATTGSSSKPPVVILLTGLDGYRPDNTLRCDEFLARGWATIILEIPGTADCPADPADPESPERLWDSLLEWMRSNAEFNMQKVMVWGLSAGGYYAIRIAHTHRRDLIGVVAQGAGCHHFYDPEWLERVDGHEYPFQ
jgi:predicted dienelactone hydrolase